MPQYRYAMQNQAVEWGYTSEKIYADPFRDVELNVVFTDDGSKTWTVPAFWAGNHEWRVRFAAPEPGNYTYRTVCSDAGNSSLHGLEGIVNAVPYEGDNELLRHGSLRIHESRRYIEHRDGTPFFWLGDTWWFCLCKRLKWPDEFQLLTADRKSKGFTVIQLVAGLYPDVPSLDERGANEAGFSWDKEFKHINPSYFDMMDLRIQWLVKSGIVPCIFGSWSYYFQQLGLDSMKMHWRNLIARYGAYPVVWCLSGEATMPYYLSESKEEDSKVLKKGWTEIGKYVRGLDPYHHPVTIHSCHFQSSRKQVDDISVFDIDMPQPGHGLSSHAPAAARLIDELVRETPKIPVVNGEVQYEGIFEANPAETQRYAFWSTMLQGAAGHTYGANGLWQVNKSDDMFGASPHGSNWGETLWDDAYKLLGSTHTGIGKKLLERYEWWKFEPHKDWVEPEAGWDDYHKPYAAGIPGKVRVYYFPSPVLPWNPPFYIKHLESGIVYKAAFINPMNGKEYPLGKVEVAKGEHWKLPLPPIAHDWVLVLENEV